jgi:predicted methyltransferase
MEHPVVLLRNVARSLKPGGRIGIVDFTKDGGGPGPAMEERVDPERVIRDAEAAGLSLRSRETFLKYQYMLVFQLAGQ